MFLYLRYLEIYHLTASLKVGQVRYTLSLLAFALNPLLKDTSCSLLP
jgi:hypothetical protein